MSHRITSITAVVLVLLLLYFVMSSLCCPFFGSVGRRQFVSFDSAQTASSVLGCEGEELHTAVFKHHLRQLLQRATGGSRERNTAAESEEGETDTRTHTHTHLSICGALKSNLRNILRS